MGCGQDKGLEEYRWAVLGELRKISGLLQELLAHAQAPEGADLGESDGMEAEDAAMDWEFEGTPEATHEAVRAKEVAVPLDAGNRGHAHGLRGPSYGPAGSEQPVHREGDSGDHPSRGRFRRSTSNLGGRLDGVRLLVPPRSRRD